MNKETLNIFQTIVYGDTLRDRYLEEYALFEQENIRYTLTYQDSLNKLCLGIYKGEQVLIIPNKNIHLILRLLSHHFSESMFSFDVKVMAKRLKEPIKLPAITAGEKLMYSSTLIDLIRKDNPQLTDEEINQLVNPCS